MTSSPYTAPEVLTIIGAFGVLLAGLGGVIVNIIVALKTTTAIKENTNLTQSTLTEAKIITGHVNGNASAAAAKIDALHGEIAALKLVFSEHKEIAALLAQGAAAALQRTRASDVAPEKFVPALEQIETNTREIAENTK